VQDAAGVGVLVYAEIDASATSRVHDEFRVAAIR
jgi:hypothetical protein